jgi:hypothetical protein
MMDYDQFNNRRETIMTTSRDITTSDKLNLAAGGISTVLVLAELAQGDYTMAFLASASAALTAGGTVSRLGVQKTREAVVATGSSAVNGAISFGTNLYNLGYMGWSMGSSYFNGNAKAKTGAAKKTDPEPTIENTGSAPTIR